MAMMVLMRLTNSLTTAQISVLVANGRVSVGKSALGKDMMPVRAEDGILYTIKNFE